MSPERRLLWASTLLRAISPAVVWGYMTDLVTDKHGGSFPVLLPLGATVGGHDKGSAQ